MSFIYNLIVIVQIISAIAMIGLILMQHGKGADMGAAFGSGASGSLFGASGSANFLSHATAVLATVFLVSTLSLAYFGFTASPSVAPQGTSVLDSIAAPATSTIPDASNISPALSASEVAPAAAEAASEVPAAAKVPAQ